MLLFYPGYNTDMQTNKEENRNNSDSQDYKPLLDDVITASKEECLLHGVQKRDSSSDDTLSLSDDPETKTDNKINIENSSDRLIYKVSDRTPIHSTFVFAFQNLLIALPWNLTIAILVAEVTCARDDLEIKATLLSTTILLSGLTTFVQVSVGIRLPVYQGPATAFVIPLLSMTSLEELKCASVFNGTLSVNDSISNMTLSMYADHRQHVVYPRLRLLQGSLLVAGVIHALVGLTGTVGAVMRFIGPITIIPTILLIGIAIYPVITDFCSVHWGISAITFIISVVLCLYLADRNLPTPVWTKDKGFHIIYYPIQQVLSMLITMLIGWGIAGIFTAAGVLTDDKTQAAYKARTDARSHVIESTPWFYLPYPGQFGSLGFHPGFLVAFLTGTFTTIIDSIGDYYACARMSRVPPPPVHALNRGIGVEGLMCAVSGIYGAGHGTTTYGCHIGSIGITKVASRHVYQAFALLLVVISVVGKVAAVFVTIPYPVLGGSQVIGLGLFLGLVMSNLQYIDMHSTRNLAIIGISMMVGLMVPYWAVTNQQALETGYHQLDGFLKTILTNPNLAGGILACLLDNTVPGTLKERGMIDWSTAGISEDNTTDVFYEESVDVYEIPWLTKKLERIDILRQIPFSPTYKK